MTVSQNIAQPTSASVEIAAKNMVNAQTGMQQSGLFDSIFVRLTETDNQKEPEQVSENPDNKPDTTAGRDLNESGGEFLATLLRRLADDLHQEAQVKPAGKETSECSVSGNEKTMPERSLMGIVNKLGNRLGHAIRDLTAEGEDSLPGSLLEDIRRAMGEMGQVTNDMTLSDKPRIKTDLSQNSGIAIENKESLRQIVTSMQALVEQYDDFMSRKQMNQVLKPDCGGTAPSEETVNASSVANRPSEQMANEILSARKLFDLPDKKQVIASLDKTNGTEDVAAVTQNEDKKLFGVKTFNTGKPGERPISVSEPVDEKDWVQTNLSEKTSLSGKHVDSPDVEVVIRDSSATGDFSKECGDAHRNVDDDGNGNLKFTDVNAGIRSFEMSAQAHKQSQDPASEPSKPLSYEQIMTQIQEKLAAHRSNGDTSQVTLRLHPEDLGELKVSMRLEDQKLKIEIVAENRVVKEVLVQNMDALKETLSRQNITMEGFDVLTGGGNGSNQQHREGRQSAQSVLANRFMQFSGPQEEHQETVAKYLDSSDNSLVDLRF